MNKFFRTVIAGYGAKKLGGGCLSTIIIFIVIYYALGNCKRPAPPVPRGTSMEMPAGKPLHSQAAAY